MSADVVDDDMGGGRNGGRKRLSGKRLLLFVVLPLLLLIGGVAGLVFSGQLNPIMEAAGLTGAKAPPPKNERPIQAVYHDLPEMLVNLKTDSPRPVFLKLSVSLELDRQEDVEAVRKVLPRVIDTFQVYLRELRPDQLVGSAGLIRLREELQRRINEAIRPTRVREVLFKEMLIQ